MDRSSLEIMLKCLLCLGFSSRIQRRVGSSLDDDVLGNNHRRLTGGLKVANVHRDSTSGFKSRIMTLPLALEVCILVTVVAFFYLQDLIVVFTDALSNEASSYVLIIPFLLLYVVYRKRKMLRASISEETQNRFGRKYLTSLTGMLLCVSAVFFYWYGSTTFTPVQYHIITLPVFLAGLILILFNTQTLRQAIFPVFLLLFLIPVPADVLNTAGSALSVYASQASNFLVNLVGIQSTMSSSYGTPTITITRPDGSAFPFYVDVACSGVYSLVAYVLFATFISFIVRDKLWKKIVIFAVGLPLVYALNIIRISSVIILGYEWGEQLALDVFHLLGGWILLFIGTLLILIVSERVFKTQIFTGKTQQLICRSSHKPSGQKQTQDYCLNCGRLFKYPKKRIGKADLTKLAAIVVAVVLLVATQTPVFALTNGPAQILIHTSQGEEGNTQLFPPIPGYNLTFMYRDTDFEEISGQNISLMYLYDPENQSQDLVWLGLEAATSDVPLHGWETCLLTWPASQGKTPPVTPLDIRDITVLQNPPVTARFFAYTSSADNQTWVTLYWYESTVFTIDNSSRQLYVELSLISNTENYTASEQQIQPIAFAIAQYWQPTKTLDQIALFLSQNSFILGALSVVLSALVATASLYERRVRKRQNSEALRKLSPGNQQLMNAIDTCQGLSNFDNIKKTYEATSDHRVSKETLQKELQALRKIGLINKRLVNVDDSPIQVWKTKTK